MIKLLPFVALVLSACSATGVKLSEVPEAETQRFVEDFSSVTKEQQRNWDAHANGSSLRGESYRTEWVQPHNIDKDCRLFFAGNSTGESRMWWNEPEVKILWDGQCRGGYAYGVGREFVESIGGLASSLATYHGGNVPPSYHLDVDYEKNLVVFRSDTSTHNAALAYYLKQGPFDSTVVVSATMLDVAEQRIYSHNWSYGEDQSSYTITFPNGNHFGRTHNTNPENYGVEWNAYTPEFELMGFGVANYQNAFGTKVSHRKFLSKGASQAVVLPRSYLQVLSAVDRDIARFEVSHSRHLQNAFLAMSKYKRRVCNDTVSIDGVETEIYNRICLKSGELSTFSSVMSQDVDRQRSRHKSQRARMNERVAQVNAQRARDQALANHAAAENSRQAATAMNELSSIAQSFRQNAEQFQRSTRNYTAPTVDFGLPQQSTTNCIRTSNIVNCRTNY